MPQTVRLSRLGITIRIPHISLVVTRGQTLAGDRAGIGLLGWAASRGARSELLFSALAIRRCDFPLMFPHGSLAIAVCDTSGS
jgi:hypothetical protein